jgi:hypothetical protein
VSIPKELMAVHAAYAVGGYDAGQAMYAFYPTAESIFPVLPREIEILPDTMPGTFGIAWFMGLNAVGQPRFAVRDDFALTSKVAWHEDGHALEEVIVNRRVAQFGGDYVAQEDYVRGAYWLWRQFPGTWREAYDYAATIGVATAGGWAYLPGESVAESLSAAVGGYVQSEWTATYGKDLALAPGNIYDPSGGGMRARVFWLEQMREVDMDEATVKSIADQAAQEAVERYSVSAIATGFQPIKDAFNKHGHLDVTGTHRITGIPIVE